MVEMTRFRKYDSNIAKKRHPPFFSFVWSTITILVPTGDQDPTVRLTKSFWMAVDPPILVAKCRRRHLMEEVIGCPWQI